jgi:hypothetical protein
MIIRPTGRAERGEEMPRPQRKRLLSVQEISCGQITSHLRDLEMNGCTNMDRSCFGPAPASWAPPDPIRSVSIVPAGEGAASERREALSPLRVACMSEQAARPSHRPLTAR